MGIQDLLHGVVGFHVPGPSIQLNEENQIDLAGLDVLQKLQHHLALGDGLPGRVTFIAVYVHNFVTMFPGILQKVIFLCLQGIAVHGLFLCGHADIQCSPENIARGIFNLRHF